jgi:hypothetical protein
MSLIVMSHQPSDEVEWSLIVDESVVCQSTDILDCIAARDGTHNGRITDDAGE